jgi:hypothetical protein
MRLFAGVAAVAAAAFPAAVLFPAAAFADTIQVVPGEGNPIQDAVDASSDGDTILVGPGTYTSGVVIIGKNNLRIRGGMGTLLESTGFYLEVCERVTIDGFQFANATDAQVGIHANACPQLTLKNLRVEGYGDAGILLEACDGARVTKVFVLDGPGAGLRDVGSEGLVIEKSTFKGNAGWAIDLSTAEEGGSHGSRISRNTVTGPAFGIAADGEDLRVEGNTIDLETGPGILLGVNAEAARALVQRNAVDTTGNGERGIDVEGPLCRVAKNSVTGGAGLGIIVQGNGSRIEGNTVTAGGISQGFHCDGDDLRVTGNVAQGVQGFSFFVGQGSRSLLSRNRALDAGSIGFYLSQPDAVVTKNVSQGAVTGFSLNIFPMTLTANVAEESSYTDVISSFSESQFVLSRNRFTTFVWDYVFDPV